MDPEDLLRQTAPQNSELKGATCFQEELDDLFESFFSLPQVLSFDTNLACLGNFLERHQAALSSESARRQQQDILRQYQEEYLKYRDIHAQIQEQYKIIENKLEQGLYKTYLDFEQNLSIFKEFCLHSFLKQKNYRLLLLISEFIYAQNKAGARLFAKKEREGETVPGVDPFLASQINRSNMMHSYEDVLSVIDIDEPDPMKQSTYIQEIQQSNNNLNFLFEELSADIERLSEDKPQQDKEQEIIFKLAGPRDSQRQSCTVLSLQTNWKAFEKQFKSLQINLANNNKLINNQKKIIRKLKENTTRGSQSFVQGVPREKAQSKIIELETQLEENTYLKNTEKNLFLRKESNYIKQIQGINKLNNDLYENQSVSVEHLKRHFHKQLEEQRAEMDSIEEQNLTLLDQVKDLRAQLDSQKPMHEQQLQQLSQENEDLRMQMKRDKEFMAILEENLTDQKNKEGEPKVIEEKVSDEKYIQMVIKYENIIKDYQSKVQHLLDEKHAFTKKMDDIFTQQLSQQQVHSREEQVNAKIKSLQTQLIQNKQPNKRGSYLTEISQVSKPTTPLLTLNDELTKRNQEKQNKLHYQQEVFQNKNIQHTSLKSLSSMKSQPMRSNLDLHSKIMDMKSVSTSGQFGQVRSSLSFLPAPVKTSSRYDFLQ